MSPFVTEFSGTQAAIAEIVANAKVRQRFPAFVLKQAGELFVYAGDKAHVKDELKNLLSLGSPDPAVVYRGLLIQLNGLFEGFIKSLVSTHISELASQVSRFDELASDLQTSFAAHAGSVLSRIFDGSINGINYDFSALRSGIGSCFSGSSPFEINGEVFTLLMGNCTSTRLEKVFSQVGLPEPFGDSVGRHKAVQKWCGEGKARRAANLAKDELNLQISIRNDLVHGLATKNVVLHDVERAATFFGCLVEAYFDQATALHSPAP